jgi:hypothetical protein
MSCTYRSNKSFSKKKKSKGTLFLGVAVRRSACKNKSKLPFEYLRSSVGNIAIVQNIKEHQSGDFPYHSTKTFVKTKK